MFAAKGFVVLRVNYRGGSGRGLQFAKAITADWGHKEVEDLLAGTVNIANVYSADPRIQTENLVTLADPKGLFLASNVVPLVNKDVADSIADVINAVQAKLTAEGLVALNMESTVDQKSSADIATKWLQDNGLI